MRWCPIHDVENPHELLPCPVPNCSNGTRQNTFVITQQAKACGVPIFDPDARWTPPLVTQTIYKRKRLMTPQGNSYWSWVEATDPRAGTFADPEGQF